jgi:tetrahydromethanopterin S-methyltransferase subunit G
MYKVLIFLFIVNKHNLKQKQMRLDELASRLIILESKVNYLSTGVYDVLPVASDINELNARLTMLEATVDMLVAEKTNEVMSTIASTEGTTPDVDVIVSLSPSATFPEASEIVTAIVQAQVELPAIESEAVAGAVATAITAVVTAQPEVVTEPSDMTDAILVALTDYQAEFDETEIVSAVEMVSEIISNAGVEITEEIKEQIAIAIGAQPDPALDAIEARLDAVEAKYSSLVK